MVNKNSQKTSSVTSPDYIIKTGLFSGMQMKWWQEILVYKFKYTYFNKSIKALNSAQLWCVAVQDIFTRFNEGLKVDCQVARLRQQYRSIWQVVAAEWPQKDGSRCGLVAHRHEARKRRYTIVNVDIVLLHLIVSSFYN